MQIIELITGICMILFATLTIMVGVFMWDSFVEQLSSRAPLRSWTQVPGIHTACALWWVFLAETYRTWVLYHAGDFRSVWFIGDLFAGLCLTGGLLRAIYIFTPPEWKRRVWVYASIGAVVFVLSPTFLNALKDYIHGI